MNSLFKKRRQEFLEQCFKYARYVFNDHFVLFLLMFLVFLAMQYSQFLQHFPSNPFWVIVVLILISGFLLPLGQIASYLEKPDKYFLLVKEGAVGDWVKRATARSALLWIFIQSLLLAALYPVFARLGLPLWGFILYLLVLAGGKYLYFRYKAGQFLVDQTLSWDLAIQKESQRKQSILRFFSLFTTVKGISNSVKRRAYLDVLLRIIPKKREKTWTNLFLRSFLRNGEFLGLTLRLAILSFFFIIFLSYSLLAALLASLLNYLLLFQLLALYQAFDYQYLTSLFPLEKGLKKQGAQDVIRAVSASVLVLQTLLAFVFFSQKIYVLLLLAFTLVFLFLYLPYKLKRQVDE